MTKAKSLGVAAVVTISLAVLTACAGVANEAGSTTSSTTAQAPTTAGQKLGTPPKPVGGHGLDAVIGGYDANNDGKVTKEEFFGLREERFRTADTNGDGWLSEAEYVAEFELRLKRQYFDEGRGPDDAYAQEIKQAGVRFNILDRDRDGRLTWEEYKASGERTFAAYDTNADGVISRDDLQRPREESNRDGSNAQRNGTAVN